MDLMAVEVSHKLYNRFFHIYLKNCYCRVSLFSSENQRMEKLTVPQLKNLLKQLGLPCKWLKAELIKRLMEAEDSGET